MEEKDRKYYSNPSQSPNFGHYNPLVPASLLAQLAAMKIRINSQSEPAQQQEQNKGKTMG
jgi:hypothetical protein